MLSRLIAAAAAAMLLNACATVPAESPSGNPFYVAITVDDLTAHGALPPGVTRQQVADQFIASFKAHKVPQAMGFINGVQIENEPDSAGVLTAWRKAGFPLGNHGYTHMNSAQNPVADFMGDVERNEPLLKQHMGSADWHWLRFPFLVAGSDTTHDEIIQKVTARGYKVADVTISFNDWAYTDTYARCAAKGDTQTIAVLKERYMNDVRASIARSRGMSQAIYGRDIPHVLLIHVGAFTAEMLPQMLDAFDAEGAQYTTLEAVQSDQAYADTGPRAGQGMMLDRVAQARGVAIPDLPNVSDTNEIAQMCR